MLWPRYHFRFLQFDFPGLTERQALLRMSEAVRLEAVEMKHGRVVGIRNPDLYLSAVALEQEADLARFRELEVVWKLVRKRGSGRD